MFFFLAPILSQIQMMASAKRSLDHGDTTSTPAPKRARGEEDKVDDDDDVLKAFIAADKLYYEQHCVKHTVIDHPDEGIEATLTIRRNAIPADLQADLDTLVRTSTVDPRSYAEISDDFAQSRGRSGFDKRVLVLERAPFKMFSGMVLRGAYSAQLNTNNDSGMYQFAGSAKQPYDIDATGENHVVGSSPNVQYATRRLQAIMKMIYKTNYNICLLNFMTHNRDKLNKARRGSNELGWHRDDEAGIDSSSIPCYVGGSRRPSRVAIKFAKTRSAKHTSVKGIPHDQISVAINDGLVLDPSIVDKSRKKNKTLNNGVVDEFHVLIQPGDIYAMKGKNFQDAFKHCVPKALKRLGEEGDRYSFTWRYKK
jgi:hypothetical protein